MALDPLLRLLLRLVPSVPHGPVDWRQIRETIRKATPMMRGPFGRLAVGPVEDRTAPSLAGEVPLRIYRPKRAASKSTLLFIHGGGWTTGDLDASDQTARRLCRELDVVVVASTYRLAPENPFPAAYEDAMAAAVWVLDNAADLGGDPHGVSIGGDSAGANLTAAVCIGLRDRDDEALGLSPVGSVRAGMRSQLLLYPCVDLRPSAWDLPSRIADADPGLRRDPTEQTMAAYLGGADPTNWRLSPLVAPSHADLPPALVVVLEVDPLRDEALLYADKLKGSGVAVDVMLFEHLTHGFMYLAGLLPAARRAFRAVVRRFGPLLAGQGAGGN